ncbi:hypothetical protein GCM10023082_51480 [Streptomyces tremellae]|uniref:chorismate synthase n=1 Tax=Streptomyces tremellae TaxID=1124239 RepID=A0ABP7FV17_9ACTN
MPEDSGRLDADPVRCLDADASKSMLAEIDGAQRTGDTPGGVVGVPAHGVPVGLGSHVPGGIVAEAMAALVLADAVAEKFGGDSVPEARRDCGPVSPRCRC